MLFKNLPSDTKEVLFCCGEIDCREGIGASVAKKKYENVLEAIKNTVFQYISALREFGIEYNLNFFLLPVPPHASRGKKKGRFHQRQSRNHTIQMFNDELRRILRLLDFYDNLCGEDGHLLPKYNADGTHMNPSVLPLIEEALNAFAPVK
ncbi:unnamed protein product [Heterosigma akashiwo]